VPYERGVGCEALGALDADEAVTYLAARLGDPEDWSIRALGTTGNGLVHERLLQIAADPAQETASIANRSTVASAARKALTTWQRISPQRAVLDARAGSSAVRLEGPEASTTARRPT
jgi:hypothetical protein